MKKQILLFTILIVFKSSFGQLNPINNLEWNHWYICPNNYFELSWDLPNPSQDTLVGYNIYRETDLYRFQTSTSLYNTEYGSNCDLDFLVYNGGQDFWIHVTAVYNSTQRESNYNDSAHCEGLAIGINERLGSKIRLFPNPTTGIITIDSDFEIRRIDIVSQSGKILEEFSQRSKLDLSSLPKGTYLINAYTDKSIITNVVILE